MATIVFLIVYVVTFVFTSHHFIENEGEDSWGDIGTVLLGILIGILWLPILLAGLTVAILKHKP